MTKTQTNTQINVVTGRTFTGTDAEFLLAVVKEKGFTSNDWATMNQWNKKGRSVAKGQKGTAITFVRKVENDDGEFVETTTTAFLYNRCQLQKV